MGIMQQFTSECMFFRGKRTCHWVLKLTLSVQCARPIVKRRLSANGYLKLQEMVCLTFSLKSFNIVDNHGTAVTRSEDERANSRFAGSEHFQSTIFVFLLDHQSLYSSPWTTGYLPHLLFKNFFTESKLILEASKDDLKVEDNCPAIFHGGN